MNIDLVNLTEDLNNHNLPDLGESFIQYKYIKQFNNSFFCEDLVVNEILG